MSLGKILWEITIDATNDTIRITEDTGGVGEATFDVELTQDDYDDIRALATALETQFDAESAAHGNSYSYSVDANTAGTITISEDGANKFDLLWSHANSNMRYVLGWSTTDVTNAATYTSPNQHQAGFYFGSDGPDLSADSENRAIIQTHQSVALDGTVVERPVGDIRYERRMGISLIPRAKMFKSANNEKSIEDLFEHVRGGNSKTILYYPDASSSTNYEYHVMPSGGSEDSIEGWERLDPGVERWAGELRLRKHV